MFSKILIANRGEIACRIMRTAQRMGIATVAVHSDADARCPHVLMADEAVAIGPAPSARSYLDTDAIVAAARLTGAEAVHPGYGFLSENAGLARKLHRAGIAFIGPPAKVIATMGDKIRAKRIAVGAGVSVVPGIDRAVGADAATLAECARIGFPVMVKASAGGGGRGMRIAEDETGLTRALASASAEALSAFGDGSVFVEKLIARPRHVEIQIVADAHGNVVHLGERECSVQRRHQKVIEEAPCPALDDAKRAEMCRQALALARAVKYVSVGTVEFVLAPGGAFYFLEMNTRLQVEHPVTEMITGLDMVELMIRIAAGERLPFRQDDIGFEGCAVEARLYAEDPARGFLPSAGRVLGYEEPTGEGIRVDSGIVDGSEITTHYDPILAKIAAWAPDRRKAIDRLTGALDRYRIEGLRTNGDFLASALVHPRFRAGRVTTGFIEEAFPDGFEARPPENGALAMFRAVAACAAVERDRRLTQGAQAEDGVWRLVLFDQAGECPVNVARAEDGWCVRIAGRVIGVRGRVDGTVRVFEGEVARRPFAAVLTRSANSIGVRAGGRVLDARVVPERAAAAARIIHKTAVGHQARAVVSPMPGLVIALSVQPGDEVQAGDEIAVVEAMKMENVLRAEFDGKVKAVLVEPGESIAVDQPLIDFE